MAKFKIGDKVYLRRLCPQRGTRGIPTQYFNREDVYTVQGVWGSDGSIGLYKKRFNWHVSLKMLEHVCEYEPKVGDVQFKMVEKGFRAIHWVPQDLLDDPVAIIKHCGIPKGAYRSKVKSIIDVKYDGGHACLMNTGTTYRGKQGDGI